MQGHERILGVQLAAQEGLCFELIKARFGRQQGLTDFRGDVLAMRLVLLLGSKFKQDVCIVELPAKLLEWCQDGT